MPMTWRSRSQQTKDRMQTLLSRSNSLIMSQQMDTPSGIRHDIDDIDEDFPTAVQPSQTPSGIDAMSRISLDSLTPLVSPDGEALSGIFLEPRVCDWCMYRVDCSGLGEAGAGIQSQLC